MRATMQHAGHPEGRPTRATVARGDGHAPRDEKASRPLALVQLANLAEFCAVTDSLEAAPSWTVSCPRCKKSIIVTDQGEHRDYDYSQCCTTWTEDDLDALHEQVQALIAAERP